MELIKSFGQDPSKQAWRMEIKDFILKNMRKPQRRNGNVVCLAGRELHEVTQIYDLLDFKRSNIISLEGKTSEYILQQQFNEQSAQRINVVNSSALDYFAKSPQKKVDVISLDYCGYVDNDKLKTLFHIALNEWFNDTGILVVNYLKGREGKGIRGNYTQETLHISHFIHHQNPRVLGDNPSAEEKDIYVDSILEKSIKGNVTEYQNLDISELREHTLQHGPSWIMSGGKGFWNTPSFKKIMTNYHEHIYHKHPADLGTILNAFDNNNNAENVLLGGAEQQVLHHLLAKGRERIPDVNKQNYFDWLALMMEVESEPYRVIDHQAYEYISDSGTPMVSDIYCFSKCKFTQLPKNFYDVPTQISPGKEIQTIDRSRIMIMNKLAGEYQDLHAEQMSQKNLARKDLTVNEPKIIPVSSTSTVRSKSFSDDEIEVIKDLHRQGYKSTQIVELFSDIPWQKIAGLLASETKYSNS